MALKNERGRNDKEEDDDWGGGGGGRGSDFSPNPSSKVCRHKEATMFFLHPHAGLEILNSRICSQDSPAPGNDAGGHEGCLKFLRIACAATRRGAAFWDTECLAYVDRESVTAARAAREWERGGEGGRRRSGGGRGTPVAPAGAGATSSRKVSASPVPPPPGVAHGSPMIMDRFSGANGRRRGRRPKGPAIPPKPPPRISSLGPDRGDRLDPAAVSRAGGGGGEGMRQGGR